MSKKLIAGAGVVASLAVALAPLATFATQAQTAQKTDRLSLTLNATCNLSLSDSYEHANGSGTWSTNTLSATVVNGTTYNTTNSNALGTTTFKVNCTGSQDWTMAVAGSELLRTGDKAGDGIAFGSSASYWNLTTTTSDTEVADTGTISANGTIATGAHGTEDVADTDVFVVTYNAGISEDQPSGTYAGDVVYTLSAGAHE